MTVSSGNHTKRMDTSGQNAELLISKADGMYGYRWAIKC
jgi:hypothetical protein